jgi:MerR family transcriptional regulator, light-induced transcriptional regulator
MPVMTPNSPVHHAFSPKRLALALGVSESSIKRWIDSGLISVSKTAGGHRRVPLHAVVRFVRDQGMEVVQPELLGLPAAGTSVVVDPGHVSVDHLFEVLNSERAESALGLILNAYIDGTALHELFDGPIREVLERIGAQWYDGPRGIFAEHRSTQVIVQALVQLRAMLPPAPEGAPVAVGCAPASDIYLLPSLMADVVLASVGFREINLGPDTPIEALLTAVEELRPLLVWLSLSKEPDVEAVVEGIGRIRASYPGTHVWYGGRASGLIGLGPDPLVRRLTSMGDLHAAARQILQEVQGTESAFALQTSQS